MSSTLDNLQKRPEVLAAAQLPSLIDSASGVVASDLIMSTKTRGQMLIIPTDAAYTNPAWKYYGHAIANFASVDFLDVFGTYELRLLVSGPTNTTNLALQLADIFKVVLTAADVIAVDIPTITPGMTVVIQANSKSVMWTGQRAVRLYSQATAPTM